MIQRLLIPVITLSLTACGIAPMATPNGGTTLGKGVQELSVNAMPAPSVSFAFGVRDNTDVGAVVEQQISSNYGLWLKHSVLNNPQGFSAAGFAGVFKSGDGAHSQGFGRVVSSSCRGSSVAWSSPSRALAARARRLLRGTSSWRRRARSLCE